MVSCDCEEVGGVWDSTSWYIFDGTFVGGVDCRCNAGDLSIGTMVGFEGAGRKDEVVVWMVCKDTLVAFEGAHL